MKLAYYAHVLQYLPYQLPLINALGGVVLTTDQVVFQYLRRNFPEIEVLQYIDPAMMQASLQRQEVDALVISDHYTHFFDDLRQHGCYLINTLHGVTLKPHLLLYSFDHYDLTLLPGKFLYDRILESGMVTYSHRLEVVGLPKLDPLFRGQWNRSQLLGEWGFDDQPTVLYAPTWNNQEQKRMDSSLDWRMLERLERWPSDYNLIIKLHPNTYRLELDLLHGLRGIVEQHANMVLVEDDSRYMVDTVPLYALSDLLLGDVSSVNIDYYATGKPMLLMRRPAHDQASFDPFWQEAVVLEEGDDLGDAIACLLVGDPLAAKRQEIVEKYLYKLDGQSTHRAVTAIERLLSL